MIRKPSILVIDDEKSVRFLLEANLKAEGFRVITAAGGTEALGILAKGTQVDLVISDQVMPDMDGLGLLKEIRTRFPSLPFIILTAYGSVEGAVTAMQQGAQDYVRKPWKADGMLLTIKRVLEHHNTKEENRKLKGQLESMYGFGEIVTRSSHMDEALAMAKQVSLTPRTTVALYGESGTGKELFARAIHYGGERMENRFVSVNCAGLPQTLLESELFGYVRGAFTGADRDREGRFGTARGGTILLDEIGDMPHEMQAKLLRVLEERTYEKLGSDRQMEMDCRVIVATNRDLGGLVKAGRFREDLYHRINVFPIVLPPLRKRKEDIPLLAEHFLSRLRNELGKKLPGISKLAMDDLVGYEWPGNVRELKNCIERGAILSDGELLRPDHLAVCKRPAEREKVAETKGRAFAVNIDPDAPDTSLDDIVREVLNKTLVACDNNKSLAADTLKVNRKMFYRRA